jgi:hypothetical protein
MKTHSRLKKDFSKEDVNFKIALCRMISIYEDKTLLMGKRLSYRLKRIFN